MRLSFATDNDLRLRQTLTFDLRISRSHEFANCRTVLRHKRRHTVSIHNVQNRFSSKKAAEETRRLINKIKTTENTEFKEKTQCNDPRNTRKNTKTRQNQTQDD